MGLSTHFLIWQHALRPFEGPVATLGKQVLAHSEQDVLGLLRREGLQPRFPASRPRGLPASDDFFFRQLGFDGCESMDVSSYEGARHIVDLNLPVALDFHERYGLIVDGGTLEHVFDAATAIRNVARMLKPGGTAVHVVPLDGMWNHGFYQFSPPFFLDFYRANGFARVTAYAGESLHAGLYGMRRAPTRLYEIEDARLLRDLQSRGPTHLYVVSQKGAESTWNRLPTQGFYVDMHQKPDSEPKAGWLQRLKYQIPFRWKIHLAGLREQWVSRKRRSSPWGLPHVRDLE